MIYHVKTIFPKITCLETMAARVAEVKYNVESNHEVPLTEQMKKWLDEFCDGTRKASVESTSAFPSYSVPAPSVAPAARAEGAADAEGAAGAAGAARAEGAAPPKRRRLSEMKRG